MYGTPQRDARQAPGGAPAFSAANKQGTASPTPFSASMMKSASINRRKILVATASMLGAPVLAITPIPEPLSHNSYISIFGQLIFTGRIKRVVALPGWIAKQLKDRGSNLQFEDLKFESSDKDTEHNFLEIEDARLKLAKPQKFTLAAIKSCRLERIYVSTDHLRGSEEYKNYYENFIGKEAILFLEPSTQYIGNGGQYSDRFYYISRGPNWRDGSPLPIAQHKNIQEIALHLDFIDAQKLPCEK